MHEVCFSYILCNMDKRLLILFIVLLFFVPFLLKKGAEKKDPPVIAIEDECMVFISVVGVDKPIPLEEYVVGVVAGEMPVTFHEEALKAQAIAARTYALKTTENGRKPIEATVSAQVYKTEEERRERWGKEFKQNERKVRKAIQETEGETIVYEDQLISAMFFSTSNGKTETAENFSGNPIPYLQSVESLGEELVAPEVEREKQFSLEEWNNITGKRWTENDFRSLQLVRNETNRVQQAISNNFEKTGREIREMLSLASTDFDIAYDVTNQKVMITTTGYGHGVGMSQYGAEAYAQQGWAAHQILQHYYANVEIKNFEVPSPACLKNTSLANNSE